MKTKIITYLLMGFILTSINAAQPTQIETKIDNIIVYLQSITLLTRSGSAGTEPNTTQ